MKPYSKVYKSHRIELRGEKGERALVIDGKRIRYGQFPDGLFFLHDYAYDWADDLGQLAQRYIDYLEKAAKARAAKQARARKGES